MPEVLIHPAVEGLPSRDDALVRVRARIAEQRAAFERLGARFDDGAEEVIDWQETWGPPLALYLPLTPSLLRAGLDRLEELDRDLDSRVSALSAAQYESRDGDDGWNVRMVIDHIASGYALNLLRVEVWPLDRDEAQRGALDELIARAGAHEGRATLQFGWNFENGRVRWTPRKVARVVGRLQDEWLAHAAGGPVPKELQGHEDADIDDTPMDAQVVTSLRARDAELRRLARERPRVREIAFWYRYYRDRFHDWPADETARWRATRAAFRERLLSYDEVTLAAVRVSPGGAINSVRQQLGNAIEHVKEHDAQITKILDVPRQATRS